MEGFEDPFNRQTYPWGGEDKELLDWFKQLGALRKEHPALRKGDIRYLTGVDALLAFTRTWGEETLLCAFNAEDEPVRLPLDQDLRLTRLLGTAELSPSRWGQALLLPPRSGCVFAVN